jgi:outer membrane protein OmpA-like peptidoglycan-associated protein
MRKAAILSLRGVVVALLAALPWATLQSQVDRATLFEPAERAVEEARADQAELLAPQLLRSARERLRDAQAAFDKGKDLQDIRKILDEAVKAARRAREVAQQGQRAFETLLPARDAAIRARADSLAPPLFRLAERRFAEAVRFLEKGDLESAKDRGAKAESDFRNAELVAIKTLVLGKAKALQLDATMQKCERFAPLTFSTGVSLLAEAEKVLGADRYDTARASELASRAEWNFLQATVLAKEIEDAWKTPGLIERAITSRNEQLLRLANEFGLRVAPGERAETTTEAILGQIRKLKQDNEKLQKSLVEREAALAELRSRIQEIELRHASLEEQLAAQKRELEAQRIREAKIRKVMNLFQPEEAEVLTIGKNVVIRLYGLSFPVRQAVIELKHLALLSKVQEAIREFPEAYVSVEGHTDSQGDDAANQKLSFERANAVRQYLLANMGIPEDKVTAVGYGESRPIASNDSAEGRAKNRRIEIVLQLP